MFHQFLSASCFSATLIVSTLLCFPASGDAPPPPATAVIESVYAQGVPHTDRQGGLLMQYDPTRSFFPIGIWGAQLPGKQWESEADWKVLTEGGFNTVWPWFGPLPSALEAGDAHGLQVVFMGEIAEGDLALAKGHPRLLGNVWADEPIGKVGTPEIESLFQQFNAYRDRVHAVVPGLPIFINDAPWIMDPATAWWLKWNAAGEIACHDNYPIMNRSARARSIGAEPNGIPQTVSLGIQNGREQRPQWLIVGAFEQPGEYGESFPFRFPTPEQLRACVYAGIIHGATGIVYFTWDTYVPRDGNVIGMSPNPKVAYTPNPRQEGYTRPTPATPMQLTASRALWDAATQINGELAELTPAILSPTVGTAFPFDVALEGTAPTPTPIRIMVKSLGEGKYLLLTVNLDDAVLKATFTFPGALASVGTRFENQLPLALPEGAKEFALTYEPFAVHVIEVSLRGDENK